MALAKISLHCILQKAVFYFFVTTEKKQINFIILPTELGQFSQCICPLNKQIDLA